MEEEKKEKKPVYKKVWFWVIIVILVIAFSGDSENSLQNGFEAGMQSAMNENIADENQEIENTVVPEETNTTVANPIEEPKTSQSETQTESNNVTLGQKNALTQAKSYLNFSAFSYKGLIEQLEYEGYSKEEATYGADNCGADWNEQAYLQAKSYLDFSSFSRSGLIEQLEYEGFTREQAEYGATKVGY